MKPIKFQLFAFLFIFLFLNAKYGDRGPSEETLLSQVHLLNEQLQNMQGSNRGNI